MLPAFSFSGLVFVKSLASLLSRGLNSILGAFYHIDNVISAKQGCALLTSLALIIIIQTNKFWTKKRMILLILHWNSP